MAVPVRIPHFPCDGEMAPGHVIASVVSENFKMPASERRAGKVEK